MNSQFRSSWKHFLAMAVVVTIAGSRASAANDPLTYVPNNAAVFAHLRLGDLWNSPLVNEIKKTAGKDLDKALGAIEKELGIPIPIVDTATFFFPVMPQGPGDETTFIAIFTTSKSYDKDLLMLNLRAKDAKVKDGMVALDGRQEKKLMLKFEDDKTFVVLHETLVDKFNQGPIRDNKPGVMSEALKLARAKHQFVLSVDFSQLPNEIFTAAPPELEPFLPLLKAKASVLTGDLKDKELQFALNLTCANAESAQEAERSFKLLMKLATDEIASALKDKNVLKEIDFLIPLLKEVDRGLQAVKVKRDGARLETALTLKVDVLVGETVAKLLKKINEESARAEATNNLRQIGLAMHNYHDAHNGFPPSAICDKKGKPLLSWRVAILPFIDHDALYKEFKLDEPWDSEHNKKLIAKMPKVYAISNKIVDNKTNYRVFTGNGAAFDVIQQTKLQDISDGTSNTIMVVESAEPVEWSKPDDFEFDEKLPVEKLLRFVDGKTSVVFCDGSVRFLKKGLPEKTWRILIQKNDGEPTPSLDE